MDLATWILFVIVPKNLHTRIYVTILFYWDMWVTVIMSEIRCSLCAASRKISYCWDVWGLFWTLRMRRKSLGRDAMCAKNVSELFHNLTLAAPLNSELGLVLPSSCYYFIISYRICQLMVLFSSLRLVWYRNPTFMPYFFYLFYSYSFLMFSSFFFCFSLTFKIWQKTFLVLVLLKSNKSSLEHLWTDVLLVT